MKRFLTITFITVAIAITISFNFTTYFTASTVELPKGEAKTAQTETYGKIPLSFEQNTGQTDAQVKFLSRGAGYALFLTEREAVMRLRNGDCETGKNETAKTDCKETSSILRMQFENANSQPQISGTNELEAKSNYLNLDGAGEKFTNVSNFERVNYAGIYDGVDLVFYGNERQLEYDFNVAPNADASQIALSFDGADNISIDAGGNLVAELAGGKNLQFKTPVAYQIIGGERKEIAANYKIQNSTVNFELGDYDRSNALVIDPILQYSTYLGGSGNEYGSAIKVNAAGEAYIAGATYSANFPTVNPIQPNLNGQIDGFLTKLNAAGTQIVFSTFLGGAGDEYLTDIALDSAGNVSLVGSVYVTTGNTSYDAYAGKLNASGSALVYPTVFMRGSDLDEASGVSLDGAGNAYVCGKTWSTNFPTTTGVIQPTDGSGSGAFVFRVNTNGSTAYSTYLDGAGEDAAYDIATDAAGNAYVVGARQISDEFEDGFILKINPTATALVYPTFYIGGSNFDGIGAVEIDGSGNAYIAGTTNSANFPTTAGVVQPTIGDGFYGDGFVAKVNAGGNALVWSTFLGGVASDSLNSLKRDSNGDIYVVGSTRATGDDNAFIARLNGTATTIDYSAQFGGIEYDEFYDIALDANDNVYLTGRTSSTNFPTTGATAHSGEDDAFVMKIAAASTAASTTTLNVSVTGNSIAGAEKFVAQLKAGDQVTISNISGQVNFDTTPVFPDCIYTTNANGLDRAIYDEPNNHGFCYAESGTDPLTAPNNGHAGLYMMRGAAKTFIGLNGATFTAANNQPLYLGINDASGAGSAAPNSGAFSARVVINRAATVEPTLSADTIGVLEGNSGMRNAVFTVSLSPASSQPVTVGFRTADGTAFVNRDYVLSSGTLTFAPGETSKTIVVSILGDTINEPEEDFTLELLNPRNAQTVIPRGRGIITDDDSFPSMNISDVSVTEGNSGTTNANFNVSLSNLSGNTINVNYATSNGTATAPGDYTATSGTLTFAPGDTSKIVSVPIVGDTLIEPNETFNLTLSDATNSTIADSQGIGTIINDDSGGSIQFSSATASVGEGAGSVTITVTRTGGTAAGASINYTTANGTAIGGQDFASTSGTLTFAANETSKPIVVSILDDALVEGSETFTINLSSPGGGATLGAPSTVTITITDNDSCSYSINPASTSVPATASSGTFGVTAATGCAWTAASGASWITLTSGASGSGNDTVNFTVAANTSVSQRTGTIVAAGKTFTVTQSGASQIVRKVFDFDGDGKTDISIFRPSVGQWWYYRSSDGGNYAAQFGNSTDKLVPGDFTGDGKTDIAFWRPSTGEWFILRSEDGSYYSFPFGTNGDIPAVGDFDGDGKADQAVFRPSDTNWYIRRSSDSGFTITQFGANGDAPAAGDYDGDGKTDIAIWRASAGQWWIRRSSNGSVIAFQFGSSTDKPVQGDYTGDGKADVAIWRPSTGEWFILRSEDSSYYSFPFGTSGDVPAPGDYDGDGKFDATVFRPSQSTWYVQRSTAGTLIQSFGINGDKPVPNAFVP